MLPFSLGGGYGRAKPPLVGHTSLHSLLYTLRRLRAARIKAGMTVREVAAALDISHTLIVKYENGTIAPSFDRLDALARIYGLTPAALMADQDAAIPLFAMLDGADVSEIEHLVRVLREELKA
ncbi:MAG TPA: helix-turn-helix transcriptional regulator [Roseiflexaceae bacterium]|nr:helix-turn-helix transcriptional regulator [Roseiflexaceae bacterium]